MRIGMAGTGGYATARAATDEGLVLTDDGLALECWIGGTDRWYRMDEGLTTRQRRVGAAPILETAIRVVGGDVVQRVYGAAGVVVIEVENSSPAPCVVAFGVTVDRKGTLALAGGRLVTGDDQCVLHLAHRPRGWVAGGRVLERIEHGEATAHGATEWRTPVEVALLVPLPHGTRTRATFGRGAADPRHVPAAGAVAAGWARHLDRGLRTELPEPLQSEIDAARVDALLAAPSAAAYVDLEDWGFDTEATAMWGRLGVRERRRARRRGGRESLLARVRDELVAEGDRTVDVLPGFRPEWLGQPLAAHAVPLRAGPLSFAVRWHGARPALLWDAPPGVTVRAPSLDPTWSSAEPRGEALLAEPPARLLSLGAADPSGDVIAPPEHFL